MHKWWSTSLQCWLKVSWKIVSLSLLIYTLSNMIDTNHGLIPITIVVTTKAYMSLFANWSQYVWCSWGTRDRVDMFGVLEEQEIAWICLVFLRNKRSRGYVWCSWGTRDRVFLYFFLPRLDVLSWNHVRFMCYNSFGNTFVLFF